MLSRVLADAVLVLHLAFVAFAVAGGLLALRWRWLPLVHLPALAWAAVVAFSGTVCPLTPLENALRAAGGGEKRLTSESLLRPLRVYGWIGQQVPTGRVV